jgi:hypothetical protein
VKRRLILSFSLPLFFILIMVVNFRVQAATYTFTDNFDDADVQNWTTQYGKWSIVQDDGSFVFYQSSQAEGRAFIGSVDWINYSVSAKIKVENFNGPNRVNLCARYIDGNNYYAASLINFDGGYLELRKKINGSSATIAAKKYYLATGVWYTVKLKVNGINLCLSVNGVEQLSATDHSLVSGKIGLVALKTAVKFDEITVVSLN